MSFGIIVKEMMTFFTAAKPSVPRAVGVVLLVVGGGAVCLSMTYSCLLYSTLAL